MVNWWRARHAGCGEDNGGGCGPGWGSRQWAGGYGRGGHGGGGSEEGEGEGFGGGAFGVRRPLRFLAYKLELDERQVGELARILDELKTERAQAEVDRRRSLSAFADAVAGDTFDDGKAKQAASARVATAERLRDAVTSALGRLHALLDKEQRERLAYLIRTGVLSL
jgi:Spy/CpxP family protein refolding chaperone